MEKTKVYKLLFIGFLSVGILEVVGYYLILQLRERAFNKEVKSGLDRIITTHLLDSAAVGLERFKAIHHHYPQCEGKYFLDSIKTLIRVDEVYVYAESIGENGRPIPVRKSIGRFDYLNIPHTYFGAGRPELTIMYRAFSMDSCKFYGVGENGMDEGGKGDDILF